MEEDKRKKKNKKKKNKQHRTSENAAADGSGALLISCGHSHRASEFGDTMTALAHDTPYIQQDGNVPTMNLEQESHLPEDTHQAAFPEKIKQFKQGKDELEHKEVIVQERIQMLLREKEVLLQTEATLLEKIEELENEKANHIQREASLEEQLLQLEKERDAYVHKVNVLEKKTAQMQMEKEAHLQKESVLESKLGQLLRDRESWFQKEARFEEKINHLMDEAATLSLKKVSLEEMVEQMERERDLWILQENSAKELIAKLNEDNSRLKSQVVELEELKNSLLQENHLLTENVSSLQSQILNLERIAVVSQSSSESKMYTTENGDVAPQSQAAHALVEKLITENAQLDGKVNELLHDLDHNGLQQEMYDDGSAQMAKSDHVADNTAAGVHPVVGATEPQKSRDLINEASAKMVVPDIRVLSQEDDMNSDVRGEGEHLDEQRTSLFSSSSEIVKSDEIVQIPLDENEHKRTDVETANTAQKTEIPLSDAPLIGAPFRLMSFVARYVSGADLVERNSGR